MKACPFAIAALALACTTVAAQAASISLTPQQQQVALGTPAFVDLVMNFAANESTLGGGIDLALTGLSATLVSFTPSTYFTTVADPAFSGFGTTHADNNLEIHFGSFGGLSGVNTLGTFQLNTASYGTTTLNLAINRFYGAFFSTSGSQMNVQLNGATVTVVPEPQSALLMLGGCIATFIAWRNRRCA